MATTRAELVREVNRLVLDDLDAQEASLASREAEARRALDTCVAERKEIAAKRANVVEAEKLQLAVIGLDGPIDAAEQTNRAIEQLTPAFQADALIEQANKAEAEAHVVEAHRDRKPRARVGPQRYLILTTLRSEAKPLTLDDLVRMTNLPTKRVKDQLRSDEPEVIRALQGHTQHGEPITGYMLTSEGQDLLERFEAYKRARGEPLPTPADARAEASESSDADESDDGENDALTAPAPAAHVVGP